MADHVLSAEHPVIVAQVVVGRKRDGEFFDEVVDKLCINGRNPAGRRIAGRAVAGGTGAAHEELQGAAADSDSFRCKGSAASEAPLLGRALAGVRVAGSFEHAAPIRGSAKRLLTHDAGPCVDGASNEQSTPFRFKAFLRAEAERRKKVRVTIYGQPLR